MNSLSRISERMYKQLHYVSNITLFLIMLLLVANILMRAIFNAPIYGTFELVSYMNMLVVICALSFTENENGNVIVTLFLEYMKPKLRNIFEGISYFVGFVMSVVITYDEILLVRTKYVNGDLTSNLLMPQWVFVLMLAVGFLLLTVCLLIKLLVAITRHKHIANEKQIASKEV